MFTVISLGGPMSMKDQFIEWVIDSAGSRLRDLKEGTDEEKAAVSSCECSPCTLAKTAKKHWDLFGEFSSDKFSDECSCHRCAVQVDGFPNRDLMDKDCECETCIALKADFEKAMPLTQQAEAEKPRSPLEALQGAILGMLGAPPEAQERILKKIREVSERNADEELKKSAEQKLLPAQQDRKVVDEVEEKVARLQAAFGKIKNQVEEVGKSSSNKKSAQSTAESSQFNESQEGTNMAESQLVKDRQKVDIGGKESPRFETKGTVITLPDGMSPGEAAEWLLKREKEMEATVTVNEEIDGFPFDAAIALHKALKQTFGWADTTGTPWFPTTSLTVETGVNTKEQVAWGQIKMPGIEGVIYPCAAHTKGDRYILVLHGDVKKKHRAKIAELAELTRKILKEESIYKGKAIKPHFPNVGHGDMPMLADMPKFFDSSGVNPNDVVFSKSIQEQIEVSLFTPIRQTEACRKYRIPLKRTVLLSGKYGVGKTLTAAITAQLAEQHGWTFLLLEDSSDIQKAIDFGKQHQPCVIFAEDIDRAVEGQERTTAIDDILNTIDGVESKNLEMMFVLTTNHADRINKAMMRTGRVDAFIEIEPPDAEAVQRLAQVYARGLLIDGEDLTEVGKMLAGRKPSDVREAVERSKLAAIFHRGADGASIKAEDLVTAANIMKPHFELMESPPAPEADPLEHQLKNLIRDVIGAPLAPPLPAKTNGTTKHAS